MVVVNGILTSYYPQNGSKTGFYYPQNGIAKIQKLEFAVTNRSSIKNRPKPNLTDQKRKNPLLFLKTQKSHHFLKAYDITCMQMYADAITRRTIDEQ